MTPTQRSMKALKDEGYIKNEFIVFDDHIKIFTSKNDCFLIDLKDFYVLFGNKWCSNVVGGRVYCVRNKRVNKKNQKQILHRLIKGCNSNQFQIDHIDGNTFDNRSKNLRLVTQQQNTWNRVGIGVGYKGVSKHKNMFTARLTINGRNLYLGLFDNDIDAAKAYDLAARKYFGVFARTNEDLGLYESNTEKP